MQPAKRWRRPTPRHTRLLAPPGAAPADLPGPPHPNTLSLSPPSLSNPPTHPHSPGAALHDLPASAARAVQDYREGARQRLHALHKQQREQGQGQQREAHGAGAKEGAAAGGGGAAGAAAGLSVAAPGTVATGAAAAAGPGFQTARDRELGLQQAAALVAEFRQHGGTRLPAATLQRLEERWSNVFSRNGVQGQLLPALLLPESEPAAAEERTALLEVCVGGEVGGGGCPGTGLAAFLHFLFALLPDSALPSTMESQCNIAPPISYGCTCSAAPNKTTHSLPPCLLLFCL